jgi:hypothetical protein
LFAGDLRGQINFTRWLFLALQGDVGGFGAGSQIAWFASGSIGINITRNVFLETGYRYFYMDYVKGGQTYCRAIRTLHGRRREILNRGPTFAGSPEFR